MSVDPSGLTCPSAQPDMEEARIFGVVAGTAATPRIAYLKRKAEVTEEMMSHLDGLDPTLVFRFSARCENGRCAQYGGGRCSLAQRIVAQLDPVVSELPSCQIRPTCRWYAEEGREACLRCPQVMTLVPPDREGLARVALPAETA